jgi:uncharacterized membrane protein
MDYLAFFDNIEHMMNKSIKITLGLTLADFIVLMVVIMTPLGWMLRGAVGSVPSFIVIGAFFLLGGALVFLTLKEKITGRFKKFLLLAGGSAVGFLVFVVLHNLASALLSLLFKTEIEEPVFFILAVIVCPLVFVVGSVGSMILLGRQK